LETLIGRLLEVVGLEVTSEGIRTVAGSESWRDGVSMLGAAVLKLQVLDEVQR